MQGSIAWSGNHYVRIALHCRFKIPHHCRILNRHNHTGSDEGKLSLSVPTNRQCSSTSLLVLYTTGRVQFQQHCRFIRSPGRVYFHQHCQFVFEPAVLSYESLPVCDKNRQWWLSQRCRFVAPAGSAITIGLLLTGSDVYDNTVGFLLTSSDVTFVFYCFIIYFNLYFFVESGLALYTLLRWQVHQY